jgi:DNA-directed RNA polymerase specialized sigma24 family protein
MIELIDALILKEEVADVMERLSPEQQLVIELLADKHTHSEIAYEFGVSRQAVTKWIGNIRKLVDKTVAKNAF